MPTPEPITREQALAGLSQLVNTPLARGVIKYWWASLPLAGLTWHYWRQRKAKGQATIGNIVQDIAPAVSIVAAALTINAVLGQFEQAKKPAASTLPAGSIQDASFTPVAPTGQPEDQSAPAIASFT